MTIRRLFHLEIKMDHSHKYYGSLSALCNDNANLGISKFTLDRFDFKTTYFENKNFIIRKSVLKTNSQIYLKVEKSEGIYDHDKHSIGFPYVAYEWVEKEKKEAELKVASELKAKQQAEEKAAKAPKKEKLNRWLDELNMMAPDGMNEDETAIEIMKKFEAFKKWAKTLIEI